jgi:hypothetical protein
MTAHSPETGDGAAGPFPNDETVIPRSLILVLCTLAVLGGCSSSAGEEPSTPTAPATTVPVRPACDAIAVAARAFSVEVGRLVTEGGTIEQVRAAAADLSDVLADARAASAPPARESLDEAGEALDLLQDRLAAEPLDWPAVRAAASALVTAFDGVVDLCAAGSSTTSPAPKS